MCGLSGNGDRKPIVLVMNITIPMEAWDVLKIGDQYEWDGYDWEVMEILGVRNQQGVYVDARLRRMGKTK